MAIGKQKTNIKKNKGATRNRRSEKDSQTMAKRKQKTKRQAMIYKALHRKLKIKQHEPHKYGCTHVLRKGKRILFH
jgi:hypothetical protein